MNHRPITEQDLADLLDEAHVDHRADLGAIMVTTGRCPVLGAFVVTQTAAGFEIVSERDAPHPEDLNLDTIAEAMMAIRNACRTAASKNLQETA